jgi:hypothetical protein
MNQIDIIGSQWDNILILAPVKLVVVPVLREVRFQQADTRYDTAGDERVIGTITLQTIGDKGVTIAVLSVKPTGQWAEISTSVRNAPKGVQSLKTILTGEHPVAVDWISFE